MSPGGYNLRKSIRRAFVFCICRNPMVENSNIRRRQTFVVDERTFDFEPRLRRSVQTMSLFVNACPNARRARARSFSSDPVNGDATSTNVRRRRMLTTNIRRRRTSTTNVHRRRTFVNDERSSTTNVPRQQTLVDDECSLSTNFKNSRVL